METIMIIEDDRRIREELSLLLISAGYTALAVTEFTEEPIKLLKENHPDLILMDINIPGGSGVSLCAQIRKISQVPVIFVTGRTGAMDELEALMTGGDDYITKPFSMPILVRKIGAVLRRSSMIPEQEHQTITYKNLVLDMDSYTAVVDGVSFDLTQREFEVLRELLLNQGRVLTRQNLLDKLWKYDFYGDERVVDTHIKNLRKKLGIDFIQTIRGVGYKIDKEN